VLKHAQKTSVKDFIEDFRRKKLNGGVKAITSTVKLPFRSCLINSHDSRPTRVYDDGLRKVFKRNSEYGVGLPQSGAHSRKEGCLPVRVEKTIFTRRQRRNL